VRLVAETVKTPAAEQQALVAPPSRAMAAQIAETAEEAALLMLASCHPMARLALMAEAVA
jgi:superfamily II DNA/RNA helicase